MLIIHLILFLAILKIFKIFLKTAKWQFLFTPISKLKKCKDNILPLSSIYIYLVFILLLLMNYTKAI